MTAAAFDRLTAALREHGSRVQPVGDRQAKAQCPAHDDQHASLSVTRGESRVLLKCHAGCDSEAVVKELGLILADLFDEPRAARQDAADEWMPCGHRRVDEYRYTDEEGRLLFGVARCDRKGHGCQGFRQWHPDLTAKGGRRWNLNGTRRVLYRLPEVTAAIAAGRDVYLAEGEKDVHALEAVGVAATTNPMGAGSWRPEYTEQLAGANVVIVADRDTPGREHAARVADALEDTAASVCVVEPVEGKDAADHLAAGRGVADLVSVAAHAADSPGPSRRDHDAPGETEEERNLRLAWERAQKLDSKVAELRLLDDARRKLRREQRSTQPRPTPVRLDEFLARTYDTPAYRVEQVWPTGGRVLLTAQWKAGKSTLIANLLRSLVDGQPFLDRFPVQPTRRVVLIDDELDERLLHQWLADQGIVNQPAISLITLRGKTATFDILDDDARAEWAGDLTGADVVIFDCLRPVLDALGLDENHEAGRFLVAFDALLSQAGASEAVIVHHMGHTGERVRGDSRLQDWPDAVWKLVREKDDEDDRLDDPAGPRYFSAYGRDVDVRQAELTYDHTNRRLTLGENAKNRRQAATHRKIVRAEEAVLTAVTANPGTNKTALRKVCSEQHQVGRHEDVDAAVERLVQTGLITRTVTGRTHLHYPGGAAPPRACAQCAPPRPGHRGRICAPCPYRGTYRNHHPPPPNRPNHTRARSRIRDHQMTPAADVTSTSCDPTRAEKPRATVVIRDGHARQCSARTEVPPEPRRHQL